tara:strand:+ start:514 stop:1101 length:588 start_codon:yes stop_codon:yes gene_type:complete
MTAYNAIRYNNSYENVGGLVLLSTQTASSSASVSFTSGIDSIYSEYLFLFNNIHPATNNVNLLFNMSSDGGSNYNITKTTTYFRAYHAESDAEANLVYEATEDLAQSTSYQNLSILIGNDNDQSTSGYLHLFEPSSDTFVKHFISRMNAYYSADFTFDQYVAGYGNTTSAINAVDFKMSSGNIDAGTIQMFGVVK